MEQQTRGKDEQQPTGSQRGVQLKCQIYKVDVALEKTKSRRMSVWLEQGGEKDRTGNI